MKFKMLVVPPKDAPSTNTSEDGTGRDFTDSPVVNENEVNHMSSKDLSRLDYGIFTSAPSLAKVCAYLVFVVV